MRTPTRTVAAFTRHVALALLLLLSLPPTIAAAQDVARMEAVIQARVADKTFMGAVLVARSDEVLLSKGYGFANLEWNIPNTPSTKFRLGSITKQFTAAAILLLAEQGKLALEDPIKKHWPQAPATWDAVTIFHVLSHTSGIPNHTNFPEFQRNGRLMASTPEKTMKDYVVDKPLDFAPGARMNYSNAGYVLLGLIVERASGRSYADFVQASIFTPLGMKDSGYDSNTAIIPNRAAGYSPGFSNAPFVDMTVPHGAGALYSTTEDLLRWTQGLFGGRLLSAASLEKMITPVQNNYALGVVVTTAGRKSVSHGGAIEGFNTQLWYYPDSKITVAVLGNVNGQAPAQLAGQLGQIAHGDTVRTSAERTSIELPRDKLDRFVGSYELAPTATMLITVVGNQLQSKLGAQPVVPLFAESETVFFPRVVDAEIEFELDAAGAATALVLRQNGQVMRAPRLAERTEIVLAPDVLARYPGTYQLRPGFDLVITLENGQLMTQATGQAKAPIFAEAENKFFLKAANAQIEFVRADGRVTELVLTQGGMQTRAPRQ